MTCGAVGTNSLNEFPFERVDEVSWELEDEEAEALRIQFLDAASNGVPLDLVVCD